MGSPMYKTWCSIRETCDACKGRGEIMPKNSNTPLALETCLQCKGSGLIRVEYSGTDGNGGRERKVVGPAMRTF